MKSTLVLFLLPLLSACVSNKILSKEDLNNIQGAYISFEKENIPPFTVTKPASVALFGPLSIPSQFSAGKKLIKENNLPTPDNLIADKILKELQKKYNTKTTNSATTGYKLDFDSAGMGLAYRLSAIYYDFRYNTTIKLIDQKSNATIGQYACLYYSKKETGKSYKYKEFTKDNAKLLKSMIEQISDKCSKDFLEKVLTDKL